MFNEIWLIIRPTYFQKGSLALYKWNKLLETIKKKNNFNHLRTFLKPATENTFLMAHNKGHNKVSDKKNTDKDTKARPLFFQSRVKHTFTALYHKKNSDGPAMDHLCLSEGADSVRNSWVRLAPARWCRTASRTQMSAVRLSASPQRPWWCSGLLPLSDPGPSSSSAEIETVSALSACVEGVEGSE